MLDVPCFGLLSVLLTFVFAVVAEMVERDHLWGCFGKGVARNVDLLFMLSTDNSTLLSNILIMDNYHDELAITISLC
jgi:hypothetical protein